MGSGASARRSASSMRNEIERLRKRELDLKEEVEKQKAVDEVEREATEIKLRSEKNELAGQLKEVSCSLRKQEEGWAKERNNTLKLTFSSIPLNMLNEGQYMDDSLSVKHFPMVTIAQCDVVGFSSLSSRLEPKQLIDIIDHLQALIDEVFSNKDIFIMERSSDGCVAVSGLSESLCDNEQRVTSPDSSYGSEVELDSWTPEVSRDKRQKSLLEQEEASSIKKSAFSASSYAAILATSALKLMSFSSRVKVPSLDNSQLQLRIALHSGPCSGGVVGLQTSDNGATHAPHYKLFGPTLRYVSNLCRSGLALQIRVSKQCRNLLITEERFKFERSPDYMTWDSTQPIESYWLVGREDLDLTLPSVDCAISLANYDDI